LDEIRFYAVVKKRPPLNVKLLVADRTASDSESESDDDTGGMTIAIARDAGGGRIHWEFVGEEIPRVEFWAMAPEDI
jgi:hypothetical protein